MKIRLFLCLLLVTLGTSVLKAQTPTTQGKEFWVSYMRNGYRNLSQPDPSSEKLIMIASAKRACTVTVRNPNQDWEESFNVENNGVATFTVPDNRGYNDQYGKSFKGLLVTSTDTISLYVANEAPNSYDAANVLPVNALGSEYMIQSNKSIGDQSGHPDENRASFLIVATEDDTEVQIIPSCETWDRHAAGIPYTVSLQAGECYHILNKNQGATNNTEGDFSGTTIESADGKPLAVFNGNCITSIPGGTSTGFDHVFEQAMPVDHWGKRFVVTSTFAPSYFNLLNDQVKITALFDNTTIWRDGIELTQRLNAGESYTFEMNLNTEPCSYISSDNPISVYLYNHSHRQASYGTTYGDPSMVWISPVEQNIREITFSTFQASNGLTHFVNVVCYTESVAQLTYDNNSIASQFSVVPSAPEFSYARLDNVEPGAHTIRCPSGFVAHVYGIGPNEGYAYTVGSSAKQLTKQLYVNDILSTELPNGYTICQEETVNFRVETNYDIDHVTWKFGDNGTATGAQVSHTYNSAGEFDVMSVVFREIEGAVQPFDTLGVTVHVNPFNQIEVHETTCSDTYHFRGHDYQVPCDEYVTLPGDQGCDTICHLQIERGNVVTYTFPPLSVCEEFIWYGDTIVSEGVNYLEHTVTNATPDGCDSLYLREVTIGYAPSNPITNYASCDIWYWHGITCDATDVYYKEFTTPEGCVYDSVLYFTLLQGGESFDTVAACDSYFWQNQTLTESNDYRDTITGSNGCISILNLNLTITDTPPFDKILGLSNVAVSTNFWPGEYLYYLDDSTGMDTGTVIWELSDNENGEWDFRPHGASCTIITYTMGTKTLHASSGLEGSCGKEVFKTINCSGYGVDDNILHQLKIYPNPASDEVLVEGEGVTSVSLVNILGQRLKEVPSNGEETVRVRVDDLPQGLYLIQVMTRHGNKTQLISVTR